MSLAIAIKNLSDEQLIEQVNMYHKSLKEELAEYKMRVITAIIEELKERGYAIA